MQLRLHHGMAWIFIFSRTGWRDAVTNTGGWMGWRTEAAQSVWVLTQHALRWTFGSPKASPWFNWICFVCRQSERSFKILEKFAMVSMGIFFAAPLHRRACVGACTFFAVSVACTKTDVLSTSTYAGVCAIQVFWHQPVYGIHICEHTRCRVCTCIRVCPPGSFALGDEGGEVQLMTMLVLLLSTVV